MKKGISLIVLVITIIVMIILAAAIIISISNSNVINKANQAVSASDVQNVKNAASLKYADAKLGANLSVGQTISEYIEDELVADGVIEENNPYIFTNQGGAYLIPEYDVTSNKKADYRVAGGKLYYFGSDIDRRIALKGNTNVNTDYLYVYTNMDTNEDGKCSLNDIGYLGKVTSFTEMKTPSEVAGNSSFNSSAVGANDDVVLATGMTLVLNQSYNGQPVQLKVVIYGDVAPDGTLDLASDLSIMLAFTLENYSFEEIYEAYEGGILCSVDEYAFFMAMAGDADMSGGLDLCDALFFVYQASSVFAGELNPAENKTVKDISLYNDIGESGWNGMPKQWYTDRLNVDKVMTRLPADISK